jgi:hypothetical protein
LNSKEAYYFSHDANARNDLKVSAMISKYGMAGYGQYWIIIEVLRESANFEIEQKQYTIDALAKQMQCTSDQVQSFLDSCINEYALLKSDGEKIWSESLKRRMGIKNEIIEKRRQAAISRWSNANAMQKQSKCNAIKGNKVNEKKVKEKKINIMTIPPSVEELTKYIDENRYPIMPAAFIDYYETRGWMVGKNKMKNWKAAVRTWMHNLKNKPNQEEDWIMK